MIRTVLVDDEPPARRKLRHLLQETSDFTVVGEAESAAEAIDVITKLQPDLLFLDIGLPDASGFEVVQALPATAMPIIVFVTAYDDFALKAFEVHALDYLLKPVEPSRLLSALSRIRNRTQSGDTRVLAGRLEQLLSGLQTPAPHVRRLLIQEDGRSIFLDVDRIDWIEAAKNYVCIYAASKTYVHRSTLDALAAKIDPQVFRRINRSQIVNLRRVSEVRSWFHGDSKVVLKSGAELNWSRRYRPQSLDELEWV